MPQVVGIGRETEEARFMHAAFPEFWKTVIEAVEVQVDKLKSTFPNDRSVHCDVRQDMGGLVITRGIVPRKQIKVQPNIHDCVLHVVKAPELDTLGHAERPTCETIRINGHSRTLTLHWGGKTYRKPSELSDDLLRFVCVD